MATPSNLPESVKMPTTSIIASGGLELAKFLVMLGIQEARRANATPEEIDAMYQDSLFQIEARDPADIPDTPEPVTG